MTDTPRSDRFVSTFTTPVAELDDHRFQALSVPPPDATMSATNSNSPRKGNAVGEARAEQPNFLQLNELLRQEGMKSRDFEQAIADDDASANGFSLEAERYGRRGSAGSRVPGCRRNTVRRPNRDQPEKAPRSRTSSTTSRSMSPPNSVDAFADPVRRRERAGTINSISSDVRLGLTRTISGGTHIRRPTFSEGKDGNLDPETASRHSFVEDDVCLPQPEKSGKTFTIDFEELEEFVAKVQEHTPVTHPLKHKKSALSVASKPRIFNDLRPKSATPTVPTIVTEAPTPDDPRTEKIETESSELDETFAAALSSECLGGQLEPPQNRWTFFSSNMDDTIHATELGDLLMPGESFRDLFELDPDGGVWWLDILHPTKEEVDVICKAFGVHPLTAEDIRVQETREKVELFKSYYFVCFRSFYQMDKTSEDYLEPVNVYAVVFREGIITFTFNQNPHMVNVRKRLAKISDYHGSLSSDWLCYALIDDIVDTFAHPIRDIEHQTDAIEDQVFTARAEDSRTILRSIGDCRKKVMSLLRLLGGKADVIKGFAKRCNEQYSVAPRGDVGLYLSDIQDHVVTMMSNLGHFEKMLSRSHSNYLAQIQVDNLTQGNAVNVTLGKVTFIATVLVPLNLICGLFGMNVPIPGGDSTDLRWFFGILGVIIGFVTVCLIVAKRMKFI
ncbi:hypothetical protein H2201_005823 [Coniosporium apollinis]|uniref:Uncharacterized protein n=2 Tax=Coniosporium TaxID=2810619 RepID=A0ABQ9NNJ9_9PEZI|nr:hypothetical protein H2199_004398 [Cladosporium sp. JES 115]KAJ9662946.1 hypothetical protein H2201_005823 [Coniosporium apollinis]